MKTDKPLILTARIAEPDLASFDRLRTMHFPPERNFLRAHLTMFHRLPGEYLSQILKTLHETASASPAITARVGGLAHLGAGVAFTIDSPALMDLRAGLKSAFDPWLGPQDLQGWRPHITIQNKVSRAKADDLYRSLKDDFTPYRIEITGLDLWRYLGGPWQHEATESFVAAV